MSWMNDEFDFDEMSKEAVFGEVEKAVANKILLDEIRKDIKRFHEESRRIYKSGDHESLDLFLIAFLKRTKNKIERIQNDNTKTTLIIREKIFTAVEQTEKRIKKTLEKLRKK